MRILLVSYFFAPANAVGALRATRLASHLIDAGYEVRVIAAADSGWPPTLKCALPDAHVLRTRQFDINRLPRRLATLRTALTRGPRAAERARDPRLAAREAPLSPAGRLLRGAATLYTNTLNWPDARAGWLPYAWRAGQRLLRSWRPDLVYASSPPPTCLLLGKLLAESCGVPWIAEFRDRWSDDPYFTRPAWRRTLEARLERQIIGSARAIVTVSEPWAEHYAEAYGKPTLVVLNGFEPADYAQRESLGTLHSRHLEIVYTGGIYPGRRDPAPLFQALGGMAAGPADIQVHFYGTNPAHFLPLASRHGISDMVVAHPRIPHAQAAAVQQQADVLLVMQWNDPRDRGHIPAKLFEYLGARRPILGLGYEHGVPARIIRERAAGLFANDPARIAAQLSVWLDTKRTLGQLPPLPAEVSSGFARADQFARLPRFLEAMA